MKVRCSDSCSLVTTSLPHPLTLGNARPLMLGRFLIAGLLIAGSGCSTSGPAQDTTGNDRQAAEASAPPPTPEYTTELMNRAESGDPEAQTTLAANYLYGYGVPKNKQLAADWAKKAATAGYPVAQAMLGYSYATGDILPRDLRESQAWYRRAALQGEVSAQRALGDIYSKGIGVPADMSAATMWWKRAAAQGDPKSQGMLGGCYAFGDGVPKDYVEAYTWLNLAAASSHPSKEVFAAVRDQVEREMTPDQISRAQAASRSFVPRSEGATRP